MPGSPCRWQNLLKSCEHHPESQCRPADYAPAIPTTNASDNGIPFCPYLFSATCKNVLANKRDAISITKAVAHGSLEPCSSSTAARYHAQALAVMLEIQVSV